MSATVAALFVDPKGVYSEAPDVELWDEARDARLYAGPWPVVCSSALRQVVASRGVH